MADASIQICNETRSCEKVIDYTWKIPHFFTSPAFLAKGKLSSETILIGNALFVLHAFRAQSNKLYFGDDLFISLELQERKADQIYKYEPIKIGTNVEEVACALSVIDRNGRQKYRSWGSVAKNSVEDVDVALITDFEKNRENILPGGGLTILCEIFNRHLSQEFNLEKEKAIVSNVQLEKLSRDFENLLSSKTINSDVILKVKGKSLPAHSAILSARSPILASMLKKDLASSSQIIEIEGFNIETIDYLLRYIYSGKLENIRHLSSLHLAELYIVAIKYAAPELADMCSGAMLANLSEDNIESYVLLASKHKDTKMLDFIINFIVKHEEIIDSNAWEKITMKQPDFEHQVLRALSKKLRYH